MMPSTSPRDAAADLAHAMYELGRFIRQRVVTSSDEKLHLGQIHALLLIQEQPGLTMKQLAVLMRVTSPSATTFVDRLVRSGLVSRKNDEDNRRLVRLTLTADGTKMLHAKMAQRKKVFAEILHVLSPDELGDLSRILKKLAKHCSSH